MELNILYFLVTIFFAIWIVVAAINKDIEIRKNLKNEVSLKPSDESNEFGADSDEKK